MMQAEPVREVAPESAYTLIAHLRQHPQDASRHPADLAMQLGLDAHFVERVLASVEPPEADDRDEIRLRISTRTLRRSLKRVGERFDEVSQRPTRFLVGTIAIGAALSLVLEFLTESANLSEVSSGFRVSLGSTALVLVALLGLHMALYFRRAMVRFALIGAGTLWLALVPITLVGILRARPDALLTIGLPSALGLTLLCLLYAGLGSLCAVIGGYVQLRQLERDEERMSRQDLLSRYFELQSRFRRGTAEGVATEPWEEWPLVQTFRRLPRRWSALLGAVLGLVSVLITGPMAGQGPGVRANVPLLLTDAVINVLTFLAHLGIGFLCSRPRKALEASLAATVAAALAALVPIGPFGPMYYMQPSRVVDLVFGGGLLALTAWGAAVGAQMREHTLREANLERNDQATLAAEMLRIQWRLSDGATNVCVMHVDVVRSRDMKAKADPLAVEYSFREYQLWVQATCEARGGRVHSTSGDGAVIAFDNCGSAFASARRLQTDVPYFNRQVNRLTSPFRLRIGLHMGHVAGELDEVVFTEVIDVAAHLQKASPVAGIAVSSKVAAALGEAEFVPLAREIDGHKVYLALNPVEDE